MLVIVPSFVPVYNFVYIPLPVCVSVLIVVPLTDPALDLETVPSPVDVPVPISITVHAFFSPLFSVCIYVRFQLSCFSSLIVALCQRKEELI